MIIDSTNVTKRLTLWGVFRPTFVAFSLYLTRDAFYRWDGFSYYASFNEFLPAVGLALILWSFVAVLAAVLLWLSFSILNLTFRIIGLKIESEHLLWYMGFFMLFGAFAWKWKTIIVSYVKTTLHMQTTLQIMLVVCLCISIVSIFTVWLFRDKAKQWTGIIMQRITPLVWLYCILVILAVPLVACYTWSDEPITVSQKITRNPSMDKNRPNIILVTFDSLAARHMSAYGYRRETTPFINRWSENAVVFVKAEASSNFTTSAAASLMTGKRVWTHQSYHNEGMKPVRSSTESLPRVLKDNGYFNVALVANPSASVRVLGISDSFDIAPLASEFGESASLFGWKFGIIDKMLYRVFGDKIRLHDWILKNDFILSKFINLISRNVSRTEVPPEKAFNHLIEIIDNNIPKPFFAWIHILSPHVPYLPPEPFKGKYTTSMHLRTYKSQEKLIEESSKYVLNYKSLPDKMVPSVELMRSYYDEFIRYCDKQFEAFIENLNKRKIENTMIILSADHGESFDHSYFTHGGPFLYEQVTNIPLIISLDGTKLKLPNAIVDEFSGTMENGVPFTGWDNLIVKPHPGVENPVITAAHVTDFSASFVADPFLFNDRGLLYLFYECLGDAGQRICYSTSQDGLTWTYSGAYIIGDANYNYSYPQVFKYNGNYYMMPMRGGDGTNHPVIFRATSFPSKWTLQENVNLPGSSGDPPGIAANDLTIFEYNGIWWIFAGKSGGLHAYYSTVPVGGKWTAHPSNPISTIAGLSRPAGRPIAKDNYIIFFLQDGQENYGDKVRAVKISTLTTSSYVQTELTTSPLLEDACIGTGVYPCTTANILESWRADGMHQIDVYQNHNGIPGLVAVDGANANPSLVWSIGIYEIATDNKEPGLKKRQPINTLVEQIDIPATILDLANIPSPLWMEGRSLVPLMRGDNFMSRPAFSMNFEQTRSRGHQLTKGTIAVWEGDYKLIHYYGKNESLLFNLKQDPAELNNIIFNNYKTEHRLLVLIQENLKKANNSINKRNYLK